MTVPDLFLVEGDTTFHTVTLTTLAGTKPDLTTATINPKAKSLDTGTTTTLVASSATAVGTVQISFGNIESISATREVDYEVEVTVTDGAIVSTYPSAESDPHKSNKFIVRVRPNRN